MRRFFNNIKLEKDDNGNFIMNKKGITLIALVITIVVLIILAAVAINLTLGKNGILNRAKTAKEQYQNAQEDEETQIAKYSNEIESYLDNNRELNNVSYYDGTYCTVEKVGNICILTTKDESFSVSKAWTYYDVETLPNEYKPLHKKTIYGGGGRSYAYQSMGIILDTDGKLQLISAEAYVRMPTVQIIYVAQ